MGLRFPIAIVVITLALLVEYAFSTGGVLRWLMGAMSAPQTPVEAPPTAAPAPKPKPPKQPAKVARAATVADELDALPVEASFEAEEYPVFAFDARGGDGIGARSADGAHGGSFSLFSQASSAANRGWPGWETPRRYAVTTGRTYVFRAYAASPDGASAWLDIGLYDKSNAWLGGRSTGCSRERPGGRGWELLELRYVNDDPRVTSVRLGLLQCLNYSMGRTTTLYFDDVSFAGAERPQ
jgi:hypothetical protein